jgi:Tfp pilus assembly protein PilF
MKPHEYGHAIRFRKLFCLAVLLSFITLSLTAQVQAQGGEHTLYGDLKVDESKVSGLKPLSFDVLLYSESGNLIDRQKVSNNGRYRFMNLSNGRYDLVVEVESNEVTRQRVLIAFPFKSDMRQDIALEWREDAGTQPKKGETISAADFYKRTSANKKRFEKAEQAIDKSDFAQAVALLLELLSDDASDFQAWTELGTVQLMQKKMDDAEKDYLHALEVRPDFFQALLNLGRLRLKQKNYDGAIEPLSKAVTTRPQSADANYFLGEAFLQIKKGSKAVGYLNEALRLDPVGMAEAHLRLAALYNAAGLKDKAAAEYEQFLKKKPDYSEKKKLQQYIAENKKP